MKIVIGLVFVVGLLLSCKPKVEITPKPSVKPELDFTQTKFFTFSEIVASKTIEDCGLTHYWTDKPLNIQGYVSYVDKYKRFFTLYSVLDYGSPTAASGNVSINPKDSVAISEKLTQLLDKKCFVKTICRSGQITVSKCEEIMKPEVLSVNDIDIK